MHQDDDIGKKKLKSAKEKLTRMNPEVKVEVIPELIDQTAIGSLVDDFDVIVDAMDNFPARLTLNKAAIRRIPFFHGAVHGFYDQATTIIPGKTACLRCILPHPPPPTPPPVVGVTPGIIGYI